MKKNIVAFAAFTVCIMTSLVSCEEDAKYAAPEYAGITITPNPCYEGDTVTATVNYKSMGENWYYSSTTFEITPNQRYYKAKPEYGTIPDPPTCKFVAPSAGTHTITFSSIISPTAGNTNPYVQGPSVTQKFTVQEMEE